MLEICWNKWSSGVGAPGGGWRPGAGVGAPGAGVGAPGSGLGYYHAHNAGAPVVTM